MKFVRIQCNGTMDECNETINLRNIRKILEHNSLQKGHKRIQHIYTWPQEDTSILCYGYIDGSPGTENKHDLPPSGEKVLSNLDTSDTQLLFGDICILMKHKSRYKNIDTSDYGLFYNLSFEGFDECLSSEDEASGDDDGSDLEGFIVVDDVNDVNGVDEGSDEEYELDEDTNEYTSE